MKSSAPWASAILLLTVALAAPPSSIALPSPSPTSACPSSSTYTGSASSKQAGQFALTLTLTCSSGRYGGSFVTSLPGGSFTITGGTLDGSVLTLQFTGEGATGAVTGTLSNDSFSGTFSLGIDSGPFALRRTGGKAPPAIPTLDVSSAAWHDDLAYLARELPLLHPKPYAFISRSAFDAEVARIDRELPHADGDEAYFDLDRIATSIGDAHTYIEFPPDNANLPIDIERFGSEYRVIDAAAVNARAVGAQVLAIDGISIATVRKKLLAITPSSETMLLRESRVEGFMTTGMALHGAGITDSRDSAAYALQRHGSKPFIVVVHAVAANQNVHYVYAWRKPPLYASRPGIGFWFVSLPASHMVYCRFQSYEHLAQNSLALLRFVQKVRPAKLVIDMRGNGGGSYTDGLNDLILPIAAMPNVNHIGRLFVLIDQDTFSAAMANAAQFRYRTHALLVGQVIGERPNSYQEPRQFVLPNTGLVVRYSTRYYAFVPSGPNEVIPDHLAVPTWAQFTAADDPALAWALSWH